MSNKAIILLCGLVALSTLAAISIYREAPTELLMRMQTASKGLAVHIHGYNNISMFGASWMKPMSSHTSPPQLQALSRKDVGLIKVENKSTSPPQELQNGTTHTRTDSQKHSDGYASAANVTRKRATQKLSYRVAQDMKKTVYANWTWPGVGWCVYVCMYVCVCVCMYAIYSCAGQEGNCGCELDVAWCGMVRVCMYACMHVCMYACMHVCVYIYIYMYVYVHMNINTYTHTHTYIHTHRHGHIHIHPHSHTWAGKASITPYTHTHTYMYIYIYIYICRYIYM
jgi:hypothetical protein